MCKFLGDELSDAFLEELRAHIRALCVLGLSPEWLFALREHDGHREIHVFTNGGEIVWKQPVGRLEKGERIETKNRS